MLSSCLQQQQQQQQQQQGDGGGGGGRKKRSLFAQQIEARGLHHFGVQAPPPTRHDVVTSQLGVQTQRDVVTSDVTSDALRLPHDTGREGS